MFLSVLLCSKKCQYASAERRIEQKSSIMCGFRLVKDWVEIVCINAAEISSSDFKNIFKSH